MRLLVVLAHPAPESLTAAQARLVVDEAQARGHEVRLLDLQALGLNPVMQANEWRDYAAAAPPDDLAPHVQALRWAEGLILVYPTWWNGPPALIKGWLDRVWRPGVAFTLQAGKLRPALTNLRLLGVVTTFGAPWWAATLLLGAPGRKMILRRLRPCIAPRARGFWLALHRIDSQPAAARQKFMARIRDRIARIPV